MELKDLDEDVVPNLWTNKVKLVFILGSLFQLIISILNLENIVWLVNWESGRLIAEGIPMYEQAGIYHAPTGQTHSLPPAHFPMYFYFLAVVITIFGNNQIIGRIITWIFVPLTFMILTKLTNPRTERQLIFLNIFYFLDPLLITINYYGKFDQIAIFFTLLGIYLLQREKYVITGIIFSIGILTKFFSIFPAIVGLTFLVTDRKWKELIYYTGSSVITTGSVILYHYIRWQDQFLDIIVYQISRLTPNLSLWYYTLPESISGITLMIYQLIFYIIIYILLLKSNVTRNHLGILASSSYLTIAFIIASRQYYTTYAYFFTLPLLPVIYYFYNNNQKILAILPFIFYGVLELGFLGCYNSCYPQIIDFGWYSWAGVILVFVSTLGFLVYTYVIINHRNFVSD